MNYSNRGRATESKWLSNYKLVWKKRDRIEAASPTLPLIPFSTPNLIWLVECKANRLTPETQPRSHLPTAGKPVSKSFILLRLNSLFREFKLMHLQHITIQSFSWIIPTTSWWFNHQLVPLRTQHKRKLCDKHATVQNKLLLCLPSFVQTIHTSIFTSIFTPSRCILRKAMRINFNDYGSERKRNRCGFRERDENALWPNSNAPYIPLYIFYDSHLNKKKKTKIGRDSP